MESFAMVIHKTKYEFRTRMAHFAEIYEPWGDTERLFVLVNCLVLASCFLTTNVQLEETKNYLEQFLNNFFK